MKHTFTEHLVAAIAALKQEGVLPVEAEPAIAIETPPHPEMGDLSSPVALGLAKQARMAPRVLAEKLKEKIEAAGDDTIASLEIAGPGYLNIRFHPWSWAQVLLKAREEGARFGRSEMGQRRMVQVEYVSANPTGPLHVGHGRGAAYGDVLGNLLAAAGFDVVREYYVNDAGNQMNILGRSVWYRYRELLGQQVDFPEDHYQGDYIRDLATRFRAEMGDDWGDGARESEMLPQFRSFAGREILAWIRDDLKQFGVRFDIWFSEQSLFDAGKVEQAIEVLKERGVVYTQDGALWLRSTDYGDDKDRVVVRENGVPTYLASDIAYHHDKFERGFNTIVDVWGADHHGYVPRLKAAMQGLGHPAEHLEVELVQFASLFRSGEKVSMSTRSGQFETLIDLIKEVGVDAARFFYCMRRADAHLDFDMDLAVSQSNDNPVFYVQYAHARIMSILRQAQERGFVVEGASSEDLKRLDQPAELAMIRQIARYPEVVESAALSREVHKIPYFLQETATAFHQLYNVSRFLVEEEDLRRARIELLNAVRIVLDNGLGLLGVHAPEQM
ncbi:MAG: arginine--tRNA ligase [Alphaproteobacteria bacterium CG_4_10_14_0_2_um_filter_63_37]|nr:MAG: arginine--tRNA ligase [Proteobacteria bacterium CG1_02_64_396]PJA25025.1 MAG: arginine--tRNA ligase [Alphaproteobacteria bacterium CG_4_10_14_0_2_um_filter_63_37]